MITDTSNRTPANLPWWTWVVPILLIHLGTEISLQFKYAQGVADFYLPTSIALILIQWWGPARVIPALYVNAVLSTYQWGIPTERWFDWVTYGIPETIFIILSWYLFRIVAKGKYWLPDIRSLILFLVMGIIIPIGVEVFFLQVLLVWNGDQPASMFWEHIIRNGLGEFTSNFGLAAPALFYFTPWMLKRNLLTESPSDPIRFRVAKPTQVIETLFAYVIMLSLIFVLDFKEYWFIYGIFSLYIALRFGFGPATITNFYLFMISYILPKFFIAVGLIQPHGQHGGVMNIFLGTSLLYVFAAITGRMITDVKIAEEKLQQQNAELEQANTELDRFVYSVSHDLSAPLKSILGLVNIGRLGENTREQLSYLGKIEQSVKKLEEFIREVLDYSQNKRIDMVIEQIKLQDLCKEIIDNLKYSDDADHVEVDMKGISETVISNDKMRVKIILNNLLANAMKYQKRVPGHRPQIKISSIQSKDKVVINIQDNGEGIHPDVQGKIFNMFFRGNHNSKGSGLGLYIAKEAAVRIKGNISVKSEYGQGSTFSLELEN